MGVIEQRDLESWGPQLAHLLRLTQTALDEAAAALFEGDVAASTALTAVEKALRVVRDGVEDHASVLLMARDRPAGVDVRTLVAEVHINANVEAMAVLARQVADIAESRLSRPAIPAHLVAIVREMGRVCLTMVAPAADALETGFAAGMARLCTAYPEVGRLQRRLRAECGYAELGAAVDVTLVGRFHEIFAEHAVSVAHEARLLAEASHQGR
jgi:phosphate transport system protein